MKQYQYNEKPTAIKNIGADIPEAARHHKDTYETPEELRAKAFKKQSNKALKDLVPTYKLKLTEALAISTEAARAVLIEYEFKKTVLSTELLQDFKGTTGEELRAFVLATEDRNTRELLRKKFNSFHNKRRKIVYYLRETVLPKYFEPKTKDSFREVNGHEVPWSTTSTSFDATFLAERVRAVQFGNSLSENERIYVSEKLVESIKIMDKYFSIDFKSLGFSYGARGKAGSIAHYQDSNRVLAFNRGWDGAWIHELGHAIDYTLGRVSRNLPYEVRSKYREKLETNKTPNRDYYMKNTEIFARLFEAYIKATVPEATSYMIFLASDSTLPDLDADSIQWLASVLKPILKGG